MISCQLRSEPQSWWCGFILTPENSILCQVARNELRIRYKNGCGPEMEFWLRGSLWSMSEPLPEANFALSLVLQIGGVDFSSFLMLSVPFLDKPVKMSCKSASSHNFPTNPMVMCGANAGNYKTMQTLKTPDCFHISADCSQWCRIAMHHCS